MHINKYFAASNSFCGFKSYFADIFKSHEFERIIVLKGGPGTGKSTFMKKAATYLKGKGAKIDEIFCSSDPDSLDGIIAYNGDKKIAIIDGTAPHERDAVIPGAIDEIINLGLNWDDRFIISKKNQILDILNKKNSAYSSAYFYLRVAGECEDEINKHVLYACNISNLKFYAYKLAESLFTKECQNVKFRILSSFGKYGRYSLPLKCDTIKTIGLKGNKHISRQFLKYLYERLKQYGEALTVLPYSLNPTLHDGLITPASNTMIILSETGDFIIDLDRYNIKHSINEYSRRAEQIFEDSLYESERWFKIAAELHFELEEIYSQAMDFDKNSIIIESKCSELEFYLQL